MNCGASRPPSPPAPTIDVTITIDSAIMTVWLMPPMMAGTPGARPRPDSITAGIRWTKGPR